MAHNFLEKTVFQGSNNPLTVSHKCSNGSTILVLTMDYWGESTGIPTYNGIPMTLAHGYIIAHIYYLLDPPTGTAYTISIPNPANSYVYVSASSYKADGGKTVFFHAGHNNVSNPSNNIIQISETTTKNGALLVSTSYCTTNTSLVGNKTSLITGNFTGYQDMVAQYELQPLAGLTTHSWSGTIPSPSLGIITIAAFDEEYLAPESCTSTTKYSGDSINLEASPNGAIGPYYVRFWRMPASGATNSLSYGEIGSVRSVSEGSSTSTSFTLYDTDLVAASGNTTAGIPTTGPTGAITDPHGGTAQLTAGKIRVATTVYDSCPTGAKSCISYCDVTLGCVAPTCNFTVM